MISQVLSCALLLATASLCAAKDASLRSGFPRSCFNENTSIDSRIATGVFSRHSGLGPTAIRNGRIFDTEKELLAAIKRAEIDLFAMNPDTYLSSLADLEVTPILASVVDGSPVEPLLLIARSGDSLNDLKEGHLIIDSSGRGSTPRRWINDYLLNAGQREIAEDYFDSIEEVPTASRALLPVYFGKKDAAILSKNAFDAMCELNSQLRDRLHVVCRSKPVASTLICLRRGSGFRANDLILAGEKLHEHAGGLELLKLMGMTKLVPFREEYLLYDREIHNRTSPDRRGVSDRGRK